MKNLSIQKKILSSILLALLSAIGTLSVGENAEREVLPSYESNAKHFWKRDSNNVFYGRKLHGAEEGDNHVDEQEHDHGHEDGHQHGHDHEDENEHEHHHHQHYSNAELNAHKLGAAAVILVVGGIGVFLPHLKRIKENASFSFIANSFSAGALMALAIFHLLPESIQMLDDANVGITVGKSFYNIAFILFFLGFFSLFYLEALVDVLTQKQEKMAGLKHRSDALKDINDRTEQTVPDSVPIAVAEKYSTASMKVINLIGASVGIISLGIHSLFEGAVVGLAVEPMLIWVACLSINGHKWAAGFSLSQGLIGRGLSWKKMVILLGLFVLSSPLGVIIGMIIQLQASNAGVGVCNALTAGLIMYMATEIFFKSFKISDQNRIIRTFHIGIIIALLASGLLLGLMMLHLQHHTHGHTY